MYIIQHIEKYLNLKASRSNGLETFTKSKVFYYIKFLTQFNFVFELKNVC